MRAEDEAARQLFQSGVTVRQITTDNLFCMNPDEEAQRARQELEYLEIDQAPLAETPIRRSVLLHDLTHAEGTVASVAKPIRVDEIVAGSTGLASLLPRFAERDHFYVLEGDGIQGIVTRADLQLPPVSMAVLGLVISLEIALTELIDSYSRGSWLEKLQAGRKEKLLERFGESRRTNTSITELECLDLIDRFDLVGRIEPLGRDLRICSQSQADKERKRVENLRNPLAHGRGLVSAHEDLDKTLKTVSFVQDLNKRAWELVDNSPFVWDSYLQTRIAPLRTTQDSLLRGTTEGTTVHVINVGVAYGRRRSNTAKDLTAERLHLHLSKHAEVVEEVECTSPSGNRVERAFAVVGLSRSAAVKEARHFSQQAIFEIEDDQLRVVSCQSGAVERERDWRVPR